MNLQTIDTFTDLSGEEQEIILILPETSYLQRYQKLIELQEFIKVKIKFIKLRISMANKFWNFTSYCIVFIVYGSIITSMGPVIPYLAEETGQTQTYYSFIFLCRALGYVFGGTIVKFFLQRYNLHQILIVASIIGGTSFLISTLSLEFWNLAITIFIGASCCCVINIVCNACVIKLYSDSRQDYWVQLLHTIFGIGGLLGPFIASIFGVKSYFVLGVLLLSTFPLFIFFSSPENRQSVRKTQISRPIPPGVQILVCVLFLLYIGMEVGYGSWVSSYAVMEKVATVEQATYTGSIFWISNTAFRIILIYVTIKVSLRLRILVIGLIISSVFNLAAALTQHQWFASFIGSFLNGMFLACIFALYLALPGQFDFKISKRNMANFMMYASLGQGVLAMPIGYAMGFYGPYMLYVTELGFAVLSYILIMKVITSLEISSKANYLNPPTEEFEENEDLENRLPL